MDVLTLLERLKQRNGVEDNGPLAQRIFPSKGVPAQLPTLLNGVYLPTTPMLRDRFRFAGRWENAGIAQSWLDFNEMKTPWHDDSVRDQIQLRRENWLQSIVSKVSSDRLSLFAIDVDDCEETYLLWGNDRTEPRVVTFFEYQESTFNDLAEYIRHLLS